MSRRLFLLGSRKARGMCYLFTTLKASLELEIVARSFEYMVFAKDEKFESKDE